MIATAYAAAAALFVLAILSFASVASGQREEADFRLDQTMLLLRVDSELPRFDTAGTPEDARAMHKLRDCLAGAHKSQELVACYNAAAVQYHVAPVLASQS